MEKILITGSSGFLGSHCLPYFESLNGYEVVKVSSKEYDLLHENNVIKMFEDIEPDYVVHLAARSGGIYSNRTEPADYYYKNLQLIALTFHYAYKYGAKKILVPIGGCSYPATAKAPIDESQMWNGYPQSQSAGYSMAKKMALVQSRTYKEQYGFESVIVIPGNMYGEWDNYSYNDSHVIASMIRKFYEAKLKGEKTLTFWGTGKPQRDFVYAGDVAKLLPYFLLEHKGDSPVNISSGISTTTQDLANQIAELVGYKGKIEWNTQQPDGQMEKIFSTEKLHSLGLKCDTPLKEGLTKTIKWFEENYDKGTVRL
jgi:GDP-L-fucose synthase